MPYTEELVEVRFALDDLELQLTRLGSAIRRLEEAAGLTAADTSARGIEGDLSRLAEAQRWLNSMYGQLADTAQAIEARRLALETLQDGQSLDEARATLADFRQAMSKLNTAWHSLDELTRFDLLEIQIASGRSEEQWLDHWPADAPLAQSIATRVLDPREQQLLSLYYDRGLSQKVIAEALNVSQPTVAARLAGAEVAVSIEIATLHFGERYPAVTVDGGRFGREPYRVVNLRTQDRQRTILLLTSDRLLRRPNLLINPRRMGQVTDIAVYLVSAGEFRFAAGRELGAILTQTFSAEDEIANALSLFENRTGSNVFQTR